MESARILGICLTNSGRGKYEYNKGDYITCRSDECFLLTVSTKRGILMDEEPGDRRKSQSPRTRKTIQTVAIGTDGDDELST